MRPWSVVVLVASTVLLCAAIIYTALDDPAPRFREDLERERAGLELAAERTRDEMEDELAGELRAAWERLAAFVLQPSQDPPPDVFFIDHAGHEIAPAAVFADPSEARLAAEDRAAHGALLAEAEVSERVAGADATRLERARVLYTAVLHRLRSREVRASVRLAIARCSQRLGEESLACALYRHVASDAGAARSPVTGVPLAFAAALALARVCEVSRSELDVIGASLGSLARGLDLAALETTGAWSRELGVAGADLDALLRARRELVSGVEGALSAPFRGAAAVLPAVNGNGLRIALFRRLQMHDTDVFAGTTFAWTPRVPQLHADFAARWRLAREHEDADAPSPDDAVTLPLLVEAPTGSAGALELACGAVEVTTDRLALVRAQASSARLRRTVSLWLLAGLLGASVLALVLSLRREAELVAMRGRWLEHVTHELRTPAATLAVFARLAEDDAVAPAVRARHLRILSAEAQRLGFVVENVLDLSLPGRNLRFETEDVDIEELLGELARVFAPRCEEDGIELRYRVERVPPVRTYRRGLARIVFNLLDNALRHCRSGEVARVTLAARTIAPERVEISVTDNGPGVSRAIERGLFRKRIRAFRETAGRGVGLLISAQIATSVGGALRHERVSVAGGSRFTLVLPAGERRDAAERS